MVTVRLRDCVINDALVLTWVETHMCVVSTLLAPVLYSSGGVDVN